jgi:hypothetical protein
MNAAWRPHLYDKKRRGGGAGLPFANSEGGGKNTRPWGTVNLTNDTGEAEDMRTQLVFGLSGLLALGLAACGSSTGGNDDVGGGGGGLDGATTPTPDAAITPVLDAALTPDVSVAKIDGAALDGAAIDGGAAPYVWVVVQDTEQKACTTNGPGADIDAVALVGATGAAIGYGKLLSATYTANPLGNACENAECDGAVCKYAAIGGVFPVTTLEMYTEGPKDATVSATANDSGYFSLNGGTLQIQIGDLKGAGAAVALKKGDMIKVFEVDKTYITSGDAPANCKCLPEKYTVTLQSDKGKLLKLTPTTLDAGNTTCSALTATSVDGCGSTVFMVP